MPTTAQMQDPEFRRRYQQQRYLDRNPQAAERKQVQQDAFSKARRIIIRALAEQPELAHSHLTLKTRPVYVNWIDCLDDLVDRGIVREWAQIRKRGDRRRSSVIMYAFTDEFRQVFGDAIPSFETAKDADLEAVIESFESEVAGQADQDSGVSGGPVKQLA